MKNIKKPGGNHYPAIKGLMITRSFTCLPLGLPYPQSSPTRPHPSVHRSLPSTSLPISILYNTLYTISLSYLWFWNQDLLVNRALQDQLGRLVVHFIRRRIRPSEGGFGDHGRQGFCASSLTVTHLVEKIDVFPPKKSYKNPKETLESSELVWWWQMNGQLLFGGVFQV